MSLSSSAGGASLPIFFLIEVGAKGLVEHDHWHPARLLEQAATLSDDALARHVRQ